VLPFPVLLALAGGSLQAQDALTFPQAAPHAPLQHSPQVPLQTPPQALLKPKLSALAEVPDWSKLEALGGVLTREEFERAMQEIYTDGSRFPVPWRIEGNALVVETSPGRPTINILFRESNQPAVRANRYWRTPSELPALKTDEPVLTGVHIALDPGHIGGAWARVEERWLSMKEGEAIQEGTMSLQVAKLLKPRLEALGAIVALVRPDENPVSKLKPDDLRPQARAVLLEAGVTQPVEYYSSNQEEARIISVQWQAEKLFYRVSEIRARAKRVNEELHPDLVLCLHFNAEAWGDPKNPSFVDKNHFHLLINGCYSPEELQLEDVRFEMLRRLFSRTEAQELAMAGPTADAMMQATGLPPYIYNTSNARRVSGNAAVFARNLLANRLFQCPVLYYEPYVMNHGQTYQRLLLGHYLGRTLLGDQLISSPIEDYARGVVRGLVNYYTEARRAK
jgi:N-acetylmuramoyl-L-alanine amidase